MNLEKILLAWMRLGFHIIATILIVVPVWNIPVYQDIPRAVAVALAGGLIEWWLYAAK